MDDKQTLLDTLKQWIPITLVVIIAMWGGIVSYLTNIKTKHKKFSWRELVFDVVVSSFAGFLTYLVCVWASYDGPLTVALVAIAGHMGPRAIMKFEFIHDKFIKKE